MINRLVIESDGRDEGRPGNVVSGMNRSESGQHSIMAAQYGRLQRSAVALRAMADKADTVSGCPVSPAGGMEDRLGFLRESQRSIPRPSAASGQAALKQRSA